MDSLKAIKILQPTDIMSGADAPISIQISTQIGTVNKIVYSMYAKKPSEAFKWHVLATQTLSGSARFENMFSITFDSWVFDNKQDVHLKVRATSAVLLQTPSNEQHCALT